ncbi:hypothetical protein [Convivina intestini]|uniref:hypothetical protein n=1 Tax=Convivina intestini TaxID=1505726 RepID=UPI00200BDD8B|nr:hypothetical protein [Convivina intestini]CAH1857588.1 hypothetical protein R077811_01613 [Convivina intestini]
MSDSTPIIQYADSSGNRAYAYTHWKAIAGIPQALIDAINSGFPSGNSSGGSINFIAGAILSANDASNWMLSIGNDGRLITTKTTSVTQQALSSLSLNAPNGNSFRLTVGNDGRLITTRVTT